MVIELQGQFGNKWAKIATYLRGRTDNDVKNFWSSRQKRLARILQNSGTPSNSKSLKTKKEAPGFHDVPDLEVNIFRHYTFHGCFKMSSGFGIMLIDFVV